MRDLTFFLHSFSFIVFFVWFLYLSLQLRNKIIVQFNFFIKMLYNCYLFNSVTRDAAISLFKEPRSKKGCSNYLLRLFNATYSTSFTSWGQIKSHPIYKRYYFSRLGRSSLHGFRDGENIFYVNYTNPYLNTLSFHSFF